MDDKVHIVQHLYGEGGDPDALHQAMQDDAVRQEYEALRETKQYLDQRPAARPDPQVIDRVVAAAAFPKAGIVPGKRRDRAARPNRAARRFRRAGTLSAALAFVLVVGIGLSQFWQQREAAQPPAASSAADEAGADAFMEGEANAPAPDAAPAAALAGTVEAEEEAQPARARLNAPGEQPAPEADTETRLLADEARTGGARPLLEAATPAPEDASADGAVALDEVVVAAEPPRAAAAGIAAAPLGESAAAFRRAGVRRDTNAVPGWDEADELLRVHGRIEMLRARSRELIWDESAVMSLDSLPTQPGRALPGLDAAGKKQRPRQQH